MSHALRDNDPTIAAIQIGPLDRAIIEVGDTHIGPIEITSLGIHNDAVGQMTIGNDGILVRSIGIHHMNAARVYFENEEPTGRADCA
jgi:hypothetical protein